MSHSRLQPKPTENNGKISLGFATSSSDLWGGLCAHNPAEHGTETWPSSWGHFIHLPAPWLTWITLVQSPRLPHVWAVTGHFCTRCRSICRVCYLGRTFQDTASPSLGAATQLSTVWPQLRRWQADGLIINHSAEELTLCHLSSPPPLFFLCLAMLVSGILLFPFFASDYNLQCKETTKTLWPFFLQVPIIVIL